MFESSVVRERVVAGRRYGLIGVSVAVHSLVVAGVVAASISSISFPRRAPNEMSLYRIEPPVAIPPPLGVRPAPRPTQAAATPVHQDAAPHPAPAPVDVAPRAIPSTVDALPVSDAATSTNAGSGEPGLGTGDPNGDPNGVDLGQPASPGAIGVPDPTFAPGGEVHAATVLHRVEPEYPRSALAARIPGVVVVRCVIGKSGAVRDAEVVSSTFAAFDRPALDALRRWTFAAGTYRGRAVDTWFELTIRFSPR